MQWKDVQKKNNLKKGLLLMQLFQMPIKSADNYITTICCCQCQLSIRQGWKMFLWWPTFHTAQASSSSQSQWLLESVHRKYWRRCFICSKCATKYVHNGLSFDAVLNISIKRCCRVDDEKKKRFMKLPFECFYEVNIDLLH